MGDTYGGWALGGRGAAKQPSWRSGGRSLRCSCSSSAGAASRRVVEADVGGVVEIARAFRFRCGEGIARVAPALTRAAAQSGQATRTMQLAAGARLRLRRPRRCRSMSGPAGTGRLRERRRHSLVPVPADLSTTTDMFLHPTFPKAAGKFALAPAIFILPCLIITFAVVVSRMEHPNCVVTNLHQDLF